MKYLIKWKARETSSGELIRDETTIDNTNLGDAERQFYKEFNFTRYSNLKVTSIKEVGG